MWDVTRAKFNNEYSLVVLAGGYLRVSKRRDLLSIPKGFIELADGDTMISKVLSAFSNLEPIKQLIVAVPEGYEKHVSEIIRKLNSRGLKLPSPQIVSSGSELIDTVDNALSAVTLERVVATATDTPFIKRQHVHELLLRADILDGDVMYPVISEEVYRKRFPGSKRTFIRTRRGKFCGTGVVIFKRAIYSRLKRFAQLIIQNRKSPVKMAKIFGWKFLVGLVLGGFSLLDIQNELNNLLDLRGYVILSEYPELAFNVDTEGDLNYLMRDQS